MKKIFSLLMLVACSACMNAQVVKMHVWKNGSYTVCSVEDVDSITFVVSDAASNYKAVDLGLPSGTLWADRNVGADAPEAYGDYFAWGEVTPKTEYNYSTYKWCNGSSSSMTKYCTNRSHGTVDGKTVLDLEDDAAYVNMGSEWRMPTNTEQRELMVNCTWTWTTQNGVYGRKVTGLNGNSIFLPAAGFRDDSDLNNAGSLVYCWSSSVDESDSPNSWYLGSRPGNYDWLANRIFGFSVRAVLR
jgi:hypothetical protein